MDDVSMILAADLPTLKCGIAVKEFRFAPERKFRADWALPDVNVLIEIEGGAFVNGRHVRGKGYVADMEKYNLAQALGFRLYRFTPSQVRSGEMMAFLKKVVR